MDSTASEAPENEDDDLPSTQPIDGRVLKDVVAFVDVRSGNDNRTQGVSKQLELMGATVCKTFTKKVTHVIFNEGSKATFEKAKRLNLHLLSALWVNSCKTNGVRVSENFYPAFVSDDYHSKIVKLRKLRSMQPIDLSEAYERSERTLKRRIRREQRKKFKERYKSAGGLLQLPADYADEYDPNEDFYKIDLPNFRSAPIGLCLYDTSSDEASDEENEEKIPNLARRLFNKMPDSPILQEAFARGLKYRRSKGGGNSSLDTSLAGTSFVAHAAASASTLDLSLDASGVDTTAITAPSTSSKGDAKRPLSSTASVATANAVSDISHSIPTTELRTLTLDSKLESPGSVPLSTGDVVDQESEDLFAKSPTRPEPLHGSPDDHSISTTAMRTMSLKSTSESSGRLPLTTAAGEVVDQEFEDLFAESPMLTESSHGSPHKRILNGLGPLTLLSSVGQTGKVNEALESRDSSASNSPSKPSLKMRISRGANPSSPMKIVSSTTSDLRSTPVIDVPDSPIRRLTGRSRSSLGSSVSETPSKNRRRTASKMTLPSVATIDSTLDFNRDQPPAVATSDELVDSLAGASNNDSSEVAVRSSSARRRSCGVGRSRVTNASRGSTSRSNTRRSALLSTTIDTSPSSNTLEQSTTTTTDLLTLPEEDIFDSGSRSVEMGSGGEGGVADDKSTNSRSDLTIRRTNAMYEQIKPGKKVVGKSKSPRVRSKATTKITTAAVQSKIKFPAVAAASASADIALNGSVVGGNFVSPTRPSASTAGRFSNKRKRDSSVTPTASSTSVDVFDPREALSSTPRPGQRVASESRVIRAFKVAKSEAKSTTKKRLSLEDFKAVVAKPKRVQSSMTDFCKSGARSLAATTKHVVLTSFSINEREILIPIIGKLGGARLGQQVESRTTHVVCADERRTLSVLFGTVQGCWLLSVQWIYKSLEAGKWLDESAFEMSQAFPSAATFRRERDLDTGLAYRCRLFDDSVNPVYVNPQTSMPPAADLTQLLQLAGAKVTRNAKDAKTIVGSYVRGSDALCVPEKWVLDSISQNQVLPYDEYLISSLSPAYS